ncbi:hypothetical protein EUGRSUZ_H00045 [Eucalyptus grandis]|uniref:Uncharacterized protein n=2 Tax=Eucalyptus grandis TaxID=71139 RepID=A0ACC3JM05_EUCGR|nr:hypothetical protein EUGRSUZ_H00045 [Eucalyptus grandis]
MAAGFGIESGGGVAVAGKHYPGKVTAYVLITCIAAATGGLMFGYDVGISGSVTSMAPFLKRFFPAVYREESSDEFPLTMLMSSPYMAAILAPFNASRLPQRCSMLLGGVIFLLGALINAAAWDIYMLMVGRNLLGIGLGFVTRSVPLYLSEMAPYKHRGSLNALFQLSISVGILCANVVNHFTQKMANGEGWRVSLGGAAVPALIIGVSAFFLPNSPNSILEEGNPTEAREMLRRIRGVSDCEVKASKAMEYPWLNLGRRKYRPHLIMSLLIPMFQQLTGINVVMFYAPVLFIAIGFGNYASLMSALITGVVNVVATLISVYGTDKWGRRRLFFWGGGLMLIFQVALALASPIGRKFGVTGQADNLPSWYAIVVVICICIFVSAFAFSWGPLGWLVPSEIFPLEIRSAAQSIVVCVNMFFTFLIVQIFPTMFCHMKFGLFIFFAFFVALMTAYIYYFLPETKNIPIEKMSQVWEEHWYWKKYMVVDGPPFAEKV